MSDNAVSVLEQEMRGLVQDMKRNPFPWSAWANALECKTKESKKLLEKLNRVNSRLALESDFNDIWRAVFGSAYVLGLALQGIQFQERRNKGEEPNPESEFNKFLEIYPPKSRAEVPAEAQAEVKAEVEQRKREWRNSRMSEGKQRAEAKKLIANARSLATDVGTVWDFPSVHGHLSAAGARALFSQLNAFADSMSVSLMEQPFQKENFERLKLMHLCALKDHFMSLCGKPKFQLIADFASLVDPGIVAECGPTAKSIRGQIKKFGDKKGI